jgi:site-specific DNA-methyltransferase (adenine-specific)
MGSGTTLIAAAMLGRKGVGIDVDKGYCKLAEKRILNAPELLQQQLPLEEGNSGER